jgi:hypothetical protein
VLALLLMLYECEQLIYLRHQLSIATKNLSSMVQTDFCSIDQAVGFRNTTDCLAGKIVSFQRNNIDTAGPGGLAV